MVYDTYIVQIAFCTILMRSKSQALDFPIVLFHRASKVAATRGARMEDRRHVLESRPKVQGGPGPGHHQSFPSEAGSCFVEGEGLLAF